jgi:hypothetical protein
VVGSSGDAWCGRVGVGGEWCSGRGRGWSGVRVCVKGGDAFPLGSGGAVLDVVGDVNEHAGKVDADAVGEAARDSGGYEVERDAVEEGGRPEGAIEGAGVLGRGEGHFKEFLQLVRPRGREHDLWGKANQRPASQSIYSFPPSLKSQRFLSI